MDLPQNFRSGFASSWWSWCLLWRRRGGLFGYRYWTRPVTLTVAVGSIDGEAAKAMEAIASRFVSTKAPVRFKVVDTGNALEAAQAFAAGKVDLAVVRGDVGDFSQGGSVVIVARVVAMIIAPPGSSIDSMAALKGRTVGVIGGEANAKLVDILSKEYGLVRTKVFKNVALADARHALQSKEINALLVVIPLSSKYLSLVRGFFQQGPKSLPVLISIDSAGAIAEAERAYESFDIPKGTLRGSPPVPDDDLTTLRTVVIPGCQQEAGFRSGRQPDGDHHERAQGAFGRGSDFCTNCRSQYRRRCLSSAAQGSGGLLQRHHAKLYG